MFELRKKRWRDRERKYISLRMGGMTNLAAYRYPIFHRVSSHWLT
jgi:hypothetical protein